MFLDKLTDIQQGIVLSLATSLMEADGKIAQEETALLESLRKQMLPGVSPMQASLGDLAGIFSTRVTRVVMLLELLGMAHVDAEYHVTEKDFISAIAKSVGITESALSDMESWVRRQFSLVREAERLMED